MATPSLSEVIPAVSPGSEPARQTGHFPLVALIALITIWAFVPVLQNGFVNWDDKALVSNAGYRGFGWGEIKWMFAAFHFGQYQPLTWMTFGLDHVLWWADPFGHHWTNLLLHLGNTLLFYYVGLALLSYLRAGNPSTDSTGSRATAGIAALTFAIHPLRVESVAWASARGDLIAATFFLLSILGYLKSNAPAGLHRNPVRWTMISMSAFLLSLLAGPSGLFLPIILLVLDGYRSAGTGEMQSHLASEAGRILRKMIPYFALSLLWIVVTFAARNSPMVKGTLYQDEFFIWALHHLAAPSFYLWKTILPFALSPVYELSGGSLAAHVAASAIICVGIATLRKRWPALALAWVCYLLLELPVLRGEFSEQQVLADRYSYLATLPLTLLIGVAVEQCCLSGVARRWRKGSLSLVSGVALFLWVGMGVLSRQQVRVWKDSETLWKHAIAVAPSSVAYFNLATLEEAQGKHEEAIAGYQHVVATDPRRWDAHEKAAQLLQERGNIAAAIGHYRSVVEINPSALDARENLASLLVIAGDYEWKSLGVLRRAQDEREKLATAEQDKIGEAVQHFRKLLEFAPQRNHVRTKLGAVLAVAGHTNEAAEILRAAVKADPDDGIAMMRLGQVLAAQGKLGEAVPYFREAARLRPQDAQAHQNLGRGLVELGMKDEATKHLEEALRILRSSPATR